LTIIFSKEELTNYPKHRLVLYLIFNREFCSRIKRLILLLRGSLRIRVELEEVTALKEQENRQFTRKDWLMWIS
jgi:hypothetical protein